MNIETWLKQNTRRIPSDSPHLDLELLLSARLKKTRAYLIAFADEKLSDHLLVQLEDDVKKLANGYPLAYLLGKKSFWDMELTVNEATLIPRSDTETLVEIAAALLPKDTQAKMIDLGTGSGAIAIALSRLFPKAHITATDTSPEALLTAKKNAANWQNSPILLLENSWLEGFSADEFDLIVSNPPYIVEDDPHLAQLTYEPISALTAPQEGLADIKTIINQSKKCLKTSGWILLEHGYNQGETVRNLFSPTFWQQVQTHRDLGENERITMAQKI